MCGSDIPTFPYPLNLRNGKVIVLLRDFAGPLNLRPFVNVKERPPLVRQLMLRGWVGSTVFRLRASWLGEHLSASEYDHPQENVNWITDGIKSGRKVDLLSPHHHPETFAIFRATSAASSSSAPPSNYICCRDTPRDNLPSPATRSGPEAGCDTIY